MDDDGDRPLFTLEERQRVLLALTVFAESHGVTNDEAVTLVEDMLGAASGRR